MTGSGTPELKRLGDLKKLYPSGTLSFGSYYPTDDLVLARISPRAWRNSRNHVSYHI